MPTPTTEVRTVKDDAAVPGLEPGHHAYLILRGETLLGVVASGSASRGKWWVAAQVMPNRKIRFGGATGKADSKGEAVRLFLEALP